MIFAVSIVLVTACRD